jgi:hypothetical protein
MNEAAGEKVAMYKKIFGPPPEVELKKDLMMAACNAVAIERSSGWQPISGHLRRTCSG